MNLNDGREVWMNGEKVTDIHAERVFQDTLKIIHRYYELQEEKPETHLYTEKNGKNYSTTFLTPHSSEELAKKAKAYREIAKESYGMLGRTPDFINAGVAILPNYAHVLGKDEHTNYAENITNWAKHVKENDLFISHALQNPQVDRSQTLGSLLKSGGSDYAGAWVKGERPDGIIVHGAKMVNTLAPLADELLIFNTPTLTPEDDAFGLAFALPLNTKGVKTIVRKPNSKYDYSLADYPLSNAFDEIDAFIVLEDVFVPWEKVFVYNSWEKSNAFFPESGLFVHTAHQDEVRGLVKLEFVTSLALRLAKGLGLTNFLRTQEQLGRLTSNLELIRGSVEYSQLSGHFENGDVYTPNMQSLLAVRDSLTEFYDEALRLIAEFAGGSIVGIPSAKDLFTKENGELLKSSLTSPLLSAEERLLLLNLAWDVTGESFGQRQRTYEFLHGGNPMWIKIGHWENEDLSLGEEMVDTVLSRARESLNEEK
jgi:4-hydroxyphenylacetate 3-monooxygenase